MAFFGSTAHGIFLNLPSLIISYALIKESSSNYYFCGYARFFKNFSYESKLRKKDKVLNENLRQIEQLEAEIESVKSAKRLINSMIISAKGR
ncbi:hypothetical protein [Photobacterium leiognathi]|uniref:hypothetical protein n=1 Tax=Photobacterium leiognathi TaxID=553611 RepID=UPI0029822E34|nr:hypothetical protein [Photobacterium leiognathi]